MNAFDYFLKANLYGLLFASCYWLLLRRHTFFGLNRTYLLVSVALSLVLPLVSLPTQTVEDLPIPVGVITVPIETLAIEPPDVSLSAPKPDWELIGMWVYRFVALGLLLRLSVRLWSMQRLIRRSPRQRHSDYVLVQPADQTVPTFSFFQFVVLNPADARNNLIIQHELVHVREWHSADVMGMAIVQALFWGCPALWLLDRMLRQVHEFLADQVAVKQNPDKPIVYAHFLLDYAFGNRPDPLANGFFNPSLLKQRIQMLHRKATTRWALSKYVLILPLAFSLLAMTTAQEEIATVVNQVTDGTITVTGRVTSADGKPLAGATVVVKGMMFTLTDSEGKYKLADVAKDASVVFSFVGFETQVVKVNRRSSISINMPLKTKKLNEVYVLSSDSAHKPLSTTQSTVVKLSSQTGPEGPALISIQQQPEFPGGIVALGQYLQKNIRYPDKARQNKIEGDVLVKFTVTADGTIDDVFIEKGIGGDCNEEAVRIVSQMPKWLPGKQQGKGVAVQYQIPIRFALEKSEDKRTGMVEPTSHSEISIIDNSPNAPYALFNDVNPTIGSPKPLYLLNGKTEVTSPGNIDPKEIERIEVIPNAKAQVLYGSKAAHGVVSIYLKGGYEQDPELIRKTFLETLSNPPKETDYTINRQKATDKEVEQLRIENIRAINWHRTPDADRKFDIVDFYTR